MSDVYEPPKSDLSKPHSSENNSGRRENTFPEGVKGWSWGAFLLNFIWAVGNRTWIGLLALLPYIGFGIAIYLGIKGRELAWKNKRWESLEQFNRVQKSWSKWSVIIVLSALLIGLVALLIDHL